MKRKIKIKSILLILAVIFLYSVSIITESVAQESITITSHGCTSCSFEENTYQVDWSYSGDIPNVSIYFYDEAVTTIEYIIVENTPNLGTYGWNMPVSHSLDGNYSLVVCDANNHLVNDTVIRAVYPIVTFPPIIPGYPILAIGLIIGITSMITSVPIIKKLRKRA
ncbi:MAG: hypothetical protein ACFFAB_11585 [Candidatus Heimdallarchaeota archaeon]